MPVPRDQENAMGKLKLDLDALRVESFDTAARAEERGTVRGAEHTFDSGCETFEHPWCGYQTNEYATCGDHTGTGGSGGGNPTAGDTCLYASCDGYTC
jgi:hypothetical protein